MDIERLLNAALLMEKAAQYLGAYGKFLGRLTDIAAPGISGEISNMLPRLLRQGPSPAEVELIKGLYKAIPGSVSHPAVQSFRSAAGHLFKYLEKNRPPYPPHVMARLLARPVVLAMRHGLAEKWPVPLPRRLKSELPELLEVREGLKQIAEEFGITAPRRMKVHVPKRLKGKITVPQT